MAFGIMQYRIYNPELDQTESNSSTDQETVSSQGDYEIEIETEISYQPTHEVNFVMVENARFSENIHLMTE